MKSNKKSEVEKALDAKIKELMGKERLLEDVQRVSSALKRSKKDIGKAEKILVDKWGKEKAKNMLERYHNFMNGDSTHPDSKRNLITLFKGLDEFRNQIKKGSPL